jgi:hypothetical protein
VAIVVTARSGSPRHSAALHCEHVIRSVCEPVDTRTTAGACPLCQHPRSDHNATGECQICKWAKPQGGWK